MAGKHIFISYRSVERDTALKVARRLIQAGYLVWMDRLGGILPGDDWRNTLAQAVNNAFAVIAILSRNYVESTWCIRELQRTDALKVPIYPVLIGDVEDDKWPIVIQDKQYADFKAWQDDSAFERAFTELLQGIQKKFGVMPGQPGSIPAENPTPFREDVEDRGEQGLTQAQTLEESNTFTAIEAGELRKTLNVAILRYRAASEQYRINLNMADLPVLEAQKAKYRADILDLERQINALRQG